MKNAKNVKFSNGLNSFGAKFKWFLFTELQDLKLTSDYINYICPDSKRTSINHVEELRNLVKQSIIREFSPKIQDSKSFELLVDGVMHQIQKKSLDKIER